MRDRKIACNHTRKRVSREETHNRTPRSTGAKARSENPAGAARSGVIEDGGENTEFTRRAHERNRVGCAFDGRWSGHVGSPDCSRSPSLESYSDA